VKCNVPKRGWISGIGGCPNVGGICIGCTMPDFPDKLMPFMDEPPGAVLSSSLIKPYGMLIRNLRKLTDHTLDQEPAWRHNRAEYTTGYEPARPEKLHPHYSSTFIRLGGA
jgi:hydrogenase small subunit